MCTGFARAFVRGACCPRLARMLIRSTNVLGLVVVLAACSASTPSPGSTVGGTSGDEPPRRFASPYAYEQFTRAELLRAGGDWEGAIRAYRLARTSDGDDPYLLARLATALDEAGRHDEARALLAEALERDPWHEDPWLAQGEVLERAGDLTGAMASYERAERAAPVSARGPLALARLLAAGSHTERAVAVLQRLRARVLPGSDTARQATTLLERMERSSPTGPDDPRRKLQALVERGRLAEAEALLANAEPAAFGGIAAFAEAHLAIERPAQARELAEVALAKDPRDARARLVLAQAALALGAYADAADAFAAISRDQPGNAVAARGLADALRAGALPELAAAAQ
jgi:tetratricopeptide (TPR) repeat protein